MEGAHWRHLMNVIEPSMCGGDAAFFCQTSGYATWFTAGDAIRIAHYNVIDDVITRKL